MPQDEIITALKNAIEHGESLQTAMQILINSGYNPRQVQEASKFVGAGVLNMQKLKPEEQLTMPEQKKKFIKKSFSSKFSKLKFWKKKASPQLQQLQQAQQPTQQIQQQAQQLTTKQIQQPTQQIQQPQPSIQAQPIQPKLKTRALSKQLQKIKPKKSSHLKEIILIVLLLILIGILIATIYFKDTILGWFS